MADQTDPIGRWFSNATNAVSNGASNVGNFMSNLWKHGSPGAFAGGFAVAALFYALGKGFGGDFLGTIIGLLLVPIGFILGMAFGKEVIDPWISPEFGGSRGMAARAPVEPHQQAAVGQGTYIQPRPVYYQQPPYYAAPYVPYRGYGRAYDGPRYSFVPVDYDYVPVGGYFGWGGGGWQGGRPTPNMWHGGKPTVDPWHGGGAVPSPANQWHGHSPTTRGVWR